MNEIMNIDRINEIKRTAVNEIVGAVSKFAESYIAYYGKRCIMKLCFW